VEIRNFEDLDVWKRGHRLTLAVYRTTIRFPKEEQYGLVSQIRRSAVSVCANIAEGHRKGTREFIRYLDIAVASLEETKYHLLLSRDLFYCSKEIFDELYDEACEISRMLTSMIKSLRQRILA